MASKELLAELHRLQHMLDGAPSSYTTGARAAESDESEADASVQEGIAAALRAQLAQAQAEASSLKQHLTMAEREVEEMRAAASSARREGESMAAALRAQLVAQAREVDELAGALAAERQEAQALREALHQQHAGEAAAANEAALMHAVEEERWQVQQTQVAAAREETAALRSTNRELRTQLEAVRAALQEERAERSQIELRQAVMAVAAESPQRNADAQVASLKSRLALERKWRKATHAWLAGEAHAKGELERLMLNLSAAITAGPLPSGSPRSIEAPVLPPRRVTAATLHPPPPPAAAEWRLQLTAAMQAFEQRSQLLSAELSDVRLQMEALAVQ